MKGLEMSTSIDSAGQPGAASSTSAAYGTGTRAPSTAPPLPYSLPDLSDDLDNVQALLGAAYDLLGDMEEASEIDDEPASRLCRLLGMVEQHQRSFVVLAANGTKPDPEDLYNVATLIGATAAKAALLQPEWAKVAGDTAEQARRALHVNNLRRLLLIASRQLEETGDRVMNSVPQPRPPATTQPGSAS